jgi:hypothetical protein
MSLTGSESALSAAIRSKLLSENCGAVDDAPLTGMCNAIAEAVIAHITANAVVMPTLLISGAPGAPVTGTGTIT